jgi:hypothetical protein
MKSGAFGKPPKEDPVKTVAVIMALVVTSLSLGGCYVGKGKGKTPPPPVTTKG